MSGYFIEINIAMTIIKSYSIVTLYCISASYQTDVDDIHGKSDRAMMRALPQEEREQIQVHTPTCLIAGLLPFLNILGYTDS